MRAGQSAASRKRSTYYVLLNAVLLASGLSAAPAGAKYDPPPMPPGYDDPGLKPENVLKQIVSRLRVELKDPYSIRDFILCPLFASSPIAPARKLDTWARAEWQVSFALNSKNSFGAYTGQQNVTAYFRDGKIVRTYFSTGKIESSIDAILAKAQAEYLTTKCERLSDDEIQELVSS